MYKCAFLVEMKRGRPGFPRNAPVRYLPAASSCMNAANCALSIGMVCGKYASRIAPCSRAGGCVLSALFPCRGFPEGFAGAFPVRFSYCYVVPSCQVQIWRKATCQEGKFFKAFGRSQRNRFPALATVLYADWLPQVNGPP